MAINFTSNKVQKNTTSLEIQSLADNIKLQDKTIEINENKIEKVTPDAEYDGLSSVEITVNVPSDINNQEKTVNITQNGNTEVTPDAEYSGISKVTINTNVPQPSIEANKSQSIISNGQIVITPTEGNAGMAQVTVDVNVPQSVLQESKSVNITENKTESVIPDEGFDAIKKVDITVNIPLEEKKTQTISSNSTVTITPTEGNTAMKSVEVTVNVPSSGSEYRTSSGVAFPKFLALDKAGQENIINNLIIDNNNISELFYSITSNSANELKTDLSFDFSNITQASYFLGMSAGNSSQSGSNTVTINNINQRIVAINMFNALPAYKIVLNGSGSIYGNGLCTQSCIVEFSAPNIYFENAEMMFSNCGKLTTVSNLTIGGSARGLFAAAGLTTTPEIIVKTEVNTFQMFDSKSIQTIKKVTFEQGGSLNSLPFDNGVVTIEGFVGLNGNATFSSCSSLSNESVTNIITNAADLTGQNSATLTFHSNVFANITEEQKSAATAKNWVIAQA